MPSAAITTSCWRLVVSVTLFELKLMKNVYSVMEMLNCNLNRFFHKGIYADMWNQQLENLQVESSSQETIDEEKRPNGANEGPSVSAAPPSHTHHHHHH